MKASKKGMSLDAVPAVAITLVVIAIVLSIGSTVVQDIRDDSLTNTAGCNATTTEACGHAYNASHQGLVGISEVAGWQDNIGTVVGAAVVLGIIVGAFVFFRKR